MKKKKIEDYAKKIANFRNITGTDAERAKQMLLDMQKDLFASFK